MALQIQSAQKDLAKKEAGYKYAITSASDRVFDEWHKHLFSIAKIYNRIGPDEVFEKWSEQKLTKLFDQKEIGLVHDTAVSNVLGDIEEAAGQALLIQMWKISMSGQWITFRPSNLTNEESWTFGDYVAAGFGTKSADYRRKLAFVCERVFSFLIPHVLLDKEGKRIDAQYLIERCGPYLLIQISQSIFSKKPSPEVAKKALLDILASDNPSEEVIQQASKIARTINGTEGNYFYVRELPNGGAVFHIELSDPKLVGKLTKHLEKGFAEPRLWAETNIEEPKKVEVVDENQGQHQ